LNKKQPKLLITKRQQYEKNQREKELKRVKEIQVSRSKKATLKSKEPAKKAKDQNLKDRAVEY